MVTMTPYARPQKRHRCKEETFGLCGRRWGGMIWEDSIETYILSYVKWIASPGLIYETGCSRPVHWDDPEGWDGEGGGRGDHDGDTCTPIADACQCMAKTTTIL